MILNLVHLTTRIEKTKKPDIPPRYSSLTTNCKSATVDLPAQPPNDRNKFLTSDQTFRQRSPNTP